MNGGGNAWQCGVCVTGVCMVGEEHAWQGEVHGGGHVWQGACMVEGHVAGGVCMVAGGICGRGQKKWQLQRAVRILL